MSGFIGALFNFKIEIGIEINLCIPPLRYSKFKETEQRKKKITIAKMWYKGLLYS
jgi:hypothetical protein